MTHITKSSTIYLADTNAPLRISGFAGEALLAGAPCYIKSDGKVWMSGSAIVDATATGSHPAFDGMTISAVSAANDPVTLFGLGTRIHIADSGLTIGTLYYSGSVAGMLSDTKLATYDTPIAKACSATDIRIVRGSY